MRRRKGDSELFDFWFNSRLRCGSSRSFFLSFAGSSSSLSCSSTRFDSDLSSAFFLPLSFASFDEEVASLSSPPPLAEPLAGISFSLPLSWPSFLDFLLDLSALSPLRPLFFVDVLLLASFAGIDGGGSFAAEALGFASLTSTKAPSHVRAQIKSEEKRECQGGQLVLLALRCRFSAAASANIVIVQYVLCAWTAHQRLPSVRRAVFLLRETLVCLQRATILRRSRFAKCAQVEAQLVARLFRLCSVLLLLVSWCCCGMTCSCTSGRLLAHSFGRARITLDLELSIVRNRSKAARMQGEDQQEQRRQ